MERPPERITLARPTAAPAGPALPPGLMPAALAELRSAAATFDFLRSTGDPVEFWEALRLARARRGLKPMPGGELAVPGPDEEKILRAELDVIRGRFIELVGEFRDFLKDTPNLPEPEERLEMAIAFLLASSREHEFISTWIKEPDAHRTKAADKLRSLATITDPYREAMLPWKLPSQS